MSGCIIWTGATGNHGYGVIRRGKLYQAHRVLWLEDGREIPAGHVLHHTCHTKLCVNLDHLEVMEWGEHSRVHRLEEAAAVMRCPSGHEYTEENIYRDSRGRHCRACRRERHKIYYQRNAGRIKARERERYRVGVLNTSGGGSL